MTDGKSPFEMEDPHEPYEQYSSAFQEQPDAEQYSQYAYSDQQPQYTYTDQQSQYPYAQQAYPYNDQQSQYPYAPQQTQYPYPGQQMPTTYVYNPNLATPKTSPVSVIALILGLLSIVIPPLAIVAIILGIIGIVIARKNGAGIGMSITGLILGLIITLFWVVMIVGLVSFFNDFDHPYYPSADPSVSSDSVDVEFGTYGEYNGDYALPVTITNNTSDVLEVHLTIQAQTKDTNRVLEDTYVSVIALRPGYSYTEMAFAYLLDADYENIKDARFATTEITVDTKKVNDSNETIKLGNLEYEKVTNFDYTDWETHMDVTYTNTTSVPKEMCSVDISANDPHTKETLYFENVFFEDVQPGKSVTQPAFERLPYKDVTDENPWFTREGLEYDIVDSTCD